ncbi:MAG: hypothetical protein MJ249_07510 [Kiritimatiellae bacterium]|nr:hypothetical protein [Kiritimatiellia bacterium]
MNILDADCPLFSRELLTPWRLVTLVGGLAVLVLGSVVLPSDDWDVPICFVMGIPAYVLAPWAFRQVWYLRWKWLLLAALAFWVTVDGSYTLYWGLRGFPNLPEFRPANFVYCLPLFWLAGFVWNLGRRGERFSWLLSECWRPECQGPDNRHPDGRQSVSQQSECLKPDGHLSNGGLQKCQEGASILALAGRIALMFVVSSPTRLLIEATLDMFSR